MKVPPASKALNKLTETGFRVFFFLCLVFAVLSALYNFWLALGEIGAILLLYLYLHAGITKRKKETIAYIEEMTSGIETASKGTVISSPLPVVIFRPDTDDIIWSNDRFLALTGDRDHLFDAKLSAAVPSFPTQWLINGDTTSPEPVAVGEKRYLVFGNLVRTGGEGEYLAVTYWVDITSYAKVSERFQDTRPVVAVLQLDNYEDLIRGLEEGARLVLLNEINHRVSQWLDPSQGLLCRYDRDHYLLLLEAGTLSDFYKKKFSILDAVREVQSPNGVAATLSIGIGQSAESPRQLFQFAQLALEMALGRGGDQVVVKDSEKFYFIGGRSRETERRTKIKSRVMASALFELLNTSNQVIVMGHQHPDLDVLGASVGVCAIARKKGVPVRVVRAPSPYPAEAQTQQVSALPEYQGVFVYPEEARHLPGPGTVLVVVDTNRPEQTQMPELLTACDRIVVIDHHRRAASYIENPALSFHDPYASSASELAAELVQFLLDPGDLKKEEAEAVLAGIVLDTKSFTMRTGGRTFETAAFLRKAGADTAEVKKFFQNNLQDTVARYEIIRRAVPYRKSIAIAAVETPVGRIIAGQAADELLDIAGISASFVLFFEGDQLCLSARSNSRVNVQVIAEMLGGGGNATAAGAQFRSKTIDEVEAALKSAIDSYFQDEA